MNRAVVVLFIGMSVCMGRAIFVNAQENPSAAPEAAAAPAPAGPQTGPRPPDGQARIEDGKKVKFDYTLTVDGQVVESSTGKIPVEYTHGSGQIIPGLAAELAGMHAGESKTVTVVPDQAYGPLNPQAVQTIPKASFPADFEFKEGMVVEMQDPQGSVLPAVISKVDAENVLLDFNHPLAGKTLQFDVKIVEIQ